ncbi:MAG TPA: S53 family peptidase [Polyangiaceae bacterium]|jgi:subtilase family serine protease
MRKSLRFLVVASLGGFVAVGCSSATTSSESEGVLDQPLGVAFGTAHTCDHALEGAHCHAIVHLGADGTVAAAATPSGYGPADLQSAYKLPSSSGGQGMTVAIVDAYGYPNAEADLAVYRSQYGLAPCTTANGCFKKVNQKGAQSSYPKNNSGWASEQALDVDMVSAICPNCRIVLVETNSANQSDLDVGVNTAAALGANAISNSYGGSETSSSASDQAYNHPGVAITASSGDNGYGVEFPASSPYVTAVGGTSLSHASNSRGWSETAWSGAGSGCSKYTAKPGWQTDAKCSKRTVADVSAVADPNTGVAVYETFNRRGGWQVYGGTSVASPVIASVFALAGGGDTPGTPYSHVSSLFDVTSGSNGSCGGSYLCTAGAGYDGPTGLGTPDGTGAF